MNLTIKRIKWVMDALVKENEEDTLGEDEWDGTSNPFFSEKDAQDEANAWAEAALVYYRDDSDGFNDE